MTLYLGKDALPSIGVVADQRAATSSRILATVKKRVRLHLAISLNPALNRSTIPIRIPVPQMEDTYSIIILIMLHTLVKCSGKQSTKRLYIAYAGMVTVKEKGKISIPPWRHVNGSASGIDKNELLPTVWISLM